MITMGRLLHYKYNTPITQSHPVIGVFLYSIYSKVNMNRRVFERYVQDFCWDLTLKQYNFSHRIRHACVLTYENAIISSGVNINLKNDFTRRYNSLKGIHAESLAIMRALHLHHKIISKCELWVCRNNKYSKYSKPCPMCMNIIKTFGIKTIHYTLENGEWVTLYL